jgi:hypothetical protein
VLAKRCIFHFTAEQNKISGTPWQQVCQFLKKKLSNSPSMLPNIHQRRREISSTEFYKIWKNISFVNVSSMMHQNPVPADSFST